jgi:hypothetical protein
VCDALRSQNSWSAGVECVQIIIHQQLGSYLIYIVFLYNFTVVKGECIHEGEKE